MTALKGLSGMQRLKNDASIYEISSQKLILPRCIDDLVQQSRIVLKIQKNNPPARRRNVYGHEGSMAFGDLHNQFVEEAFTRGVLWLMALLITIGCLLFFFGRGGKESKQSGAFFPWPLVGLLFVISSSISMMAGAWIHLSTGVIFYIFFITLFVFLSARTLANNRSEDGRVKKVSG